VARSSFRTSIPLLAVAYGTSSITSFLLTVTVGRSLGAAALGTFTLAVATARIFYAASDLGVATHMTRAVSRDRKRARELTSRFLTFRMLLVPLAIVVAVIVAEAYGVPNMLLFGLVAVAQGVVSLQALYEALMLAHDRQAVVALLTIATSTCVMTGCAICYALHAKLTLFAATYVATSALGLTAWVLWAGRWLQAWPKLHLDTEALAAELKQSWQIGLSVLLGIAALRIPILVLGTFGTKGDIGTFSAADTFVIAVGIAQIAVTNTTFPRLSACFRTDPPRFRQIFWLSNAAIALLGIVGGMILVLLGPRIVAMVFPGRDFDQIRELLPILGASTPALLLVHHNIILFAASDHEATNLRLMTVWFALIAASQLALVPAHGLLGAAWGLLLARSVGLVGLTFAILAAGVHRGEPALRMG
jgi:O-antigen/teichoic acid export membrane protein